MSKHTGRMDMQGNVLPQILKDQAEEYKGENARLSTFVGAIAVADLVKTTLGPKGMDKILQPMNKKDKIAVTNDGATILKNVVVDNPAAKILIDISKTQDEEVGDGTTTVAVLCGELLRESEKLMNSLKLHPQVIISGFRKAAQIAAQTLKAHAINNSDNETQFETDLMNIAKTTLSSKLVTHEKEHFARMAVDAVKRLQGAENLDMIQIIKKAGGQLRDSFLAEGFILEKKIATGCKTRLENPTIMVANTTMDTDKIKIYGAQAKVDSFDAVSQIETAERQHQKIKVQKIIDLKPDVFINRQLIYDYQSSLLMDAGICVIEHADFEGIERLALSVDAEIMSTFDGEGKLGGCAVLEEIMIGEDKSLRFSGCRRGEACSIVLRGSSTHLLDEAERSLHDALCVLANTVKHKNTIWGGGFSEMMMAEKIDHEAKKTPGKEQLAMESFAKALRTLPATICDNAGLDSASLLAQLRTQITENPGFPAGIDVVLRKVSSMQDLGITECLSVKEQALYSASEAAEQILRIDSVIKNEPRKRERPMPGR